MNQFYLLVNNEKEGPFTLDELRQKGIAGSSLVWQEGYTAWTPASFVPELRGILLPNASNTTTNAGSNTSTDDLSVIPPKTWFVEAILTVIFCCTPFGIAGLFYAIQVEHMIQTKRLDLAQLYSRKAKKWVAWAFFIGIGFWVLYVLFIFLMIAAGYFSAISLGHSYSDTVL